MKYAGWVTKNIRDGCSQIEDSLVKSDPMFDEVLGKLFGSSDMDKVLKSFQGAGISNVYTADFIISLAVQVSLATKRPRLSFLTQAEIHKKAEEANVCIKKLQSIITDFDSDGDLALLAYHYELRNIRKKGLPLTKNPFPDLKKDSNSNREEFRITDLLDLVAEDIKEVADSPALVKSPGATELSNPAGVYFIRKLYLEFIRKFDKPFQSSITRLGNIIFDDIDFNDTKVSGSIKRFQKDIEQHPEILYRFPELLTQWYERRPKS